MHTALPNYPRPLGKGSRESTPASPRHEIADPDREAPDTQAGRVPDGIGDRTGAAGDADLADALDAERVHVRIALPDQESSPPYG